MFLLLPFTIGLFIFILSLIWVVESYLAKSWLRFGLILVCVTASGLFLFGRLYFWLGPKPPRDTTVITQQMTAPM
jgi:hypothetical protein